MAKYVLGSPYMRGNSDVITSYEDTTGAIPAGVAVARKADGSVILPASGALVGIAGAREPLQHLSVVRQGLMVPVRLASGVTPAVGAPAYVTGEGLFTTESTNNTATGAVFVGDKDGVAAIVGIDPNTGNAVENCALVDVVGGL